LVYVRNKIRILLYGIMIVAILLGVFAQDIAYFLYYNLGIPLLVTVSLAIILSILLFFIPPFFRTKLNKHIGEKEINLYLGINIFIGILISAFSFIVLVAWWG